MATISEARNALENTANLNQIQEEQKEAYGMDKQVNILNNSFAQQSAMKILNEEKVTAVAPKLKTMKTVDPRRAIKAKSKVQLRGVAAPTYNR